MTDKQLTEVIEGNFLIAVFEGYTYPNMDNAVWRCSYDDLHDYHEDWNKLISALQKAKKAIKKADFDTVTERCCNQRLTAALNEVFNLNIKNAHFCFVKFIEFFNNQNKQS